MTDPEARKNAIQAAEARAAIALELFTEMNNIKTRILKEFPISTFGKTQRQIRKEVELPALMDYLKKIADRPRQLAVIYKTEDQRLIEQQKKELEEKRRRQDEIEASQLVDRAIVYLLETRPDLKIGVDYTVQTAVDEANAIAFSIAVSKEVEAIGNRYIEFIGDSYCKDCRGWDGESRRCDCGNRRVDWEQDWDFSFENPRIHAEAY